jgi:Ca-activated chloride channel family protein
MLAPIGEDQKLTRLQAVKQVVQRFVNGDGRGLDGRPNDLIGLVTFARYAETVLPLTLSHGTLEEFLRDVNVVTEQSQDGTAIGDALALAAARLRIAEEDLSDRRDYEIKSKVIILLTDGRHNAGERTPIEAGELANIWGIKIYAIGIGVGEAGRTIRTPLGNFSLPNSQLVDTAGLQALADRTGGLFRIAEDTESLAAIYQEIDKLEKSEVESVRYMNFQERFWPWVFAGLCAVVMSVFLSCTIFRRSP